MIGVTLIFVIVMIKYGFDYATNLKGSVAPKPQAPAEVPNIPVISNVMPGG